jgi:hypothetical protein
MRETVVHVVIPMPPALHARLASLATDRQESLDATVVAILRAAAEERDDASPFDTVIRPAGLAVC